MAITLLRINDFRNISSTELIPSVHGLNIIYGDNGSGKTSLLEAIYYLAHGRSFRSSVSQALIKQQTEKFSLFTQLINHNERTITLGMERERKGLLRMRLEKKDSATMSDLAACLPVLMMNSYSYQLFEAGPMFRRKYLDWGLFYQIPTFLSCWRAFERILKQRNTLLKEKRPKAEIEAWTIELSKYGEELSQLRQDYVQKLIPHFLAVTQELLSLSDLAITYQPGWNNKQSYVDALQQTFHEDWQFGHTQLGPQRANLDITINGLEVKHFLSRGQQKLLIYAMILAQGNLLQQETEKRVIYLIDDLPSKLDEFSKKKLISLLAKQKVQIFITAIDSKMIFDLIQHNDYLPTAVFHVKHGQVTAHVHNSQAS